MILHDQSLGAGPPLLCLHGFLGSGDNLWPLAHSLEATRQSFLLDLRGHGRSPWGQPYSLAALAEDVAETATALGLERFDILGHSLGGKVAMALALRHPQRVKKIVIADITMAKAQAYFDPLIKAMDATPVASLTRREEAEPYLREAEPLLETRRFLLKNLVPTETGGFQWRFDLKGLETDHALMLAEVPPTGQYQGPALLVHGDRSLLIDEAGIALTRASFPNLQVVDLPGGHWIHVDAKEAFNVAVAEFLKS